MRRWTYSWASSDGLRHEGEVCAPDKDSAYAQLRAGGIRPIRVVECQSSGSRGVKGLRKRDLSVIAILAILIGSLSGVVAMNMSRSADRKTVSPRPRHYFELVVADPATVLMRPHEVFLATYARPGVVVKAPELTPEVMQDFYDSISEPVFTDEKDDVGVVELKRVVAGMKEDAKKYLNISAGVERLAVALQARQEMEVDYREKIVQELSRRKLRSDQQRAVEDANRLLLSMGLKPINE